MSSTKIFFLAFCIWLQFDDPVMVSSNTFTVSKGFEVSRLSGANVRFYGEELCVAVTKYTEVAENRTMERQKLALFVLNPVSALAVQHA